MTLNELEDLFFKEQHTSIELHEIVPLLLEMKARIEDIEGCVETLCDNDESQWE